MEVVYTRAQGNSKIKHSPRLMVYITMTIILIY